MSRTMVLEALRKSKKGNLQYDATWHSDGHLKDIIISTSSPPPLDTELVTRSLEKLQISSDRNDLRNSFTDQTPSVKNSQNDDNHIQTTQSDADETNGISSSYSDELNRVVEKRTAKLQVSLQHYDAAIKKEAKERTKLRKEQQEQYSQKLEEEAKRNINLLQQRMELQQRALWQKISDVNTESEENRERRLHHQRERYRLHAKRLDAKMKAALEQKEQAELEKQRRKQAELQSYLRSLAKVKGQIDDQAARIVHGLETCPHQGQLAAKGDEIKALIKRLQAKADKLVHDTSLSKPSEEAFQGMTILIQKIMDISNLASLAIAEAEKQAHLAEQQEALKAKVEAEAAKVAAVKAMTAPSIQSTMGQGIPASSSVLNESIHPDSLSEYNKLQENLEAVRKSFEELKTDKNLKKYCFDIQKAINTPVNAISSQSGTHFLSKLRKLQQLLNGHTVEVGTKTVSVSTHPAGMTYCKELLAKKIVKQGQEQVSSNYKSAFPFAALAVGLWSQYPDVGDLILANFHQQCPFLVPYHVSKKENQTNEEYYKSLGYVIDNEGVIEKQDKYLKRMSGFTRLYTAILVSTPPPGCGQVNPFGREKAWQWLSRLLNLEPQPDITATMLFDFLEVCGFAMAKTYDKQFFKLIQVLIQCYFPKIEAVTPKGSGGPVTRLKSYLQKCLKSQTFPPPPGLLSTSFWRSY